MNYYITIVDQQPGRVGMGWEGSYGENYFNWGHNIVIRSVRANDLESWMQEWASGQKEQKAEAPP